MVFIGYSKRDYTTQEERTQLVIDKDKNKRTNKINDYLSQPNVKEFNAILVNKAFSRIDVNNKGRPQLFKDREQCKNEVEEYFKLCYKYDMLPTIASLSLYLGLGRQSLYEMSSTTTNDFSDILKHAIDTCQAYQETPAIDGSLSAPVWIFTAKNYFGLQDQQQINVSATSQTQSNPQTINAIKEQIANQNVANLIEHNTND